MNTVTTTTANTVRNDVTAAQIPRSQSKAKQTNGLGKFFKTPKGYLLVILLLTAVIADIGSGSYNGLLNVGVAMLTALAADLLVALLQKRKQHLFSDGGLLTGLIIALVISTATPWYITSITTLIALASKHLLKIKRKPIFNPAAVGLLVAIYAFSNGQSWWGGFAELPVWCVALTILGGYLITQKINKFPQVFAFLGTYLVLVLVLGYLHIGDMTDALRVPFINSALFLGFFMLTDPPTSPAKYGGQVFFGILTAVVSLAVYTLFGGLTYLLIGLLVANLWNAWRLKRSQA